MDAIKVTHTTLGGFAALQVETGPLSLLLVPELGGKIASLRDTRSGREWLWRHPRMAYRRVPHGTSYVAAADTGGWDECFPSVAACMYPASPWAGAPVQDHGELWSQTAATRIEASADAASIHMRWHGIMLPYQFERSIRLAAGSARLSLDYRLTSTSEEPLAWIWSAHPLIAIEPGMALEMPAGASYNVWAKLPESLVDRTRGLAFPADLATLPPPAAGVGLKLWSDPLPAGAGRAGIRAADGALRMRWDAARLPQLAIWMNLGAFSGDGGPSYYNLGLEPCIGAQDSLAQAIAAEHLAASLEPGGVREWGLEVELCPAREAA